MLIQRLNNVNTTFMMSITDSLINLCDWTSSWTFSRRIVFLIKKWDWNFDVRQKWSTMTSEMMRSLMMKEGWMEHRGCNGWSEINHLVTSWLFSLIHSCISSMVALFVTDLWRCVRVYVIALIADKAVKFVNMSHIIWRRNFIRCT